MMKCARCGKSTPGVELTPGAVSAICEDCLHPAKMKSASVKHHPKGDAKKEHK